MSPNLTDIDAGSTDAADAAEAAEFDARFRLAEQKFASRRREKLVGPTPILLAAVPVWTETLAQRILQLNPTSAVPSSFASWVNAGLVQELRSPLREEQVPQLIRFVMPAPLRSEVLAANRDEEGDPVHMWGIVQDIAAALSTIPTWPGDPEETQQWATLMARAADPRQLADNLDAEIRNAQTSTELYRILEVTHDFEPLVRQFGASLDVTLLRAGRRLELLRRHDDDRAHLRNFLVRAEQLTALEALVGRDDEHWGLHFVGAGGVGKTMLLRHICSDYAVGRFAVSRVDFDYLNPDYPRLAPGLLLWYFGEGLRAYAREASFDDWMDQANGILSKLHEELRANLSSAVGNTVDHPHFQRALVYYTRALNTLPLRVLLILDTCEELARVRPDGSVPDSVRDTFQILEALHARVPGLRVIFSGRRPLARSGHGWSCPSAPQELPDRPALRLHEIRGFTHTESASYLTGAKVPANLHAPIISRSADVGRVVAVKWEDPTFAPADVPRCNPYDLKLYAEWAREDPPPDANTLISSTAAQYVEFRIMRRLRNPLLEQLLPVIAILGHIDDDTLRHLSDLDHDTEAFERLQTALRQQEWTNVRSITDPDDGAIRRVYSVDPALRVRLRSYALEHQTGWRDLTHRAAQYLTETTATRDLSNLDWTDFEATLNVLDIEGDAQRAAEWWERIAARLRERDPPWRSDLLKFLCATQEPAQPNVQPPPLRLTTTQRLRPAILAVYTDALSDSGRSSPSDRDLWREVLDTADRYPLPAEAVRLRVRAAAGQLALAEVLPELQDVALLESILLKVPPKVMDQSTALILMKVAEASLDLMDLSELSGQLCDPALNRQMATLTAVICGDFLAPEDSGLPLFIDHSPFAEATSWTRCLRARAYLRIEEHDIALRSFDLALRRTLAGLDIQQLLEEATHQESLWVRILLEYVRLASPSLAPPPTVLEAVRTLVPDLLTRAVNGPVSLSLERLAAAYLRLQSSVRPLDTVSDISNLELALRVQPRTGNTAAQRIVPPLCCVAAEELAATGRVDAAVQHLRTLLNDSSLHEEVRRELERAYLRISLRFRLFDLGEGTVESLQRSLRPADWALQLLAETLTPGEDRINPRLTQSGLRARTLLPTASSLHAEWHSLVAPEPAVTVRDRGVYLKRWLRAFEENPDGDTSIDAHECRRLLSIAALSDQASIKDLLQGVSHNPIPQLTGGPLTEITLLRQLRHALLEESSATLNTTCEQITAGLGKRRAAELTLEEATALSLRLPDEARKAAYFAMTWFLEVGDHVGVLRAALTIALAREPAALTEMQPVYEFFKSDWRKSDLDYAGPGQQCAALMALIEKLPLVEAANRLYQPESPNLSNQQESPLTSRWKPLLFRWLLARLATVPETASDTARLLASSQVHPRVVDILTGVEFRHWRPQPIALPGAPTSAAASILSTLRKQPGVLGGILIVAALAWWIFHKYRLPVELGPNSTGNASGSFWDTDAAIWALMGSIGLFTSTTALIWRQWFVPRWVRHVCRGWTVFFMVALGLFSLLIPGVTVFILLMIIPYGGWRLVRYLRIRRALASPIAVSARELQNSTQGLSTNSGSTTVSLSFPAPRSVFLPTGWPKQLKGQIDCAAKEVQVTQTYQEFAVRLRPDQSRLFSRMRRMLGLQWAVFELIGATPETHAWPLEAAVLLNTRFSSKPETQTNRVPDTGSTVGSSPTPSPRSAIPNVRATPFRFRRTVSSAALSRNRSVRPVSTLRGSKVEANPMSAAPAEAWIQPWRRRGLTIATDPDKSTRILHLVGTPQDDSAGLRFRLLAEGSRDRGVSISNYTNSGAARLDTSMRCEEIIDTYPNLDLCIFQRSPLTTPARRNDIDRSEAALMRILSARLLAKGVPLVMTLPSLPHTQAAAVTDLIARYAAKKGRRDGNAFLEMLDDVRHSISRSSPRVLELFPPDILDAQKTAQLLLGEWRALLMGTFTPAGRKELERWTALPVESLTGLLVDELNPMLRQQDLIRLAPLKELPLMLYPQLLLPWTPRFVLNRIVLTKIFPGCFTDGEEVARADAWETTLDVCGFAAPSPTLIDSFAGTAGRYVPPP